MSWIKLWFMFICIRKFTIFNSSNSCLPFLDIPIFQSNVSMTFTAFDQSNNFNIHKKRTSDHPVILRVFLEWSQVLPILSLNLHKLGGKKYKLKHRPNSTCVVCVQIRGRRSPRRWIRPRPPSAILWLWDSSDGELKI